MKLKKIAILSFFIIALAMPSFAFADDPYGISKAAQSTQLMRTTQSLPEIIGGIIGIALSFVGIVFFLLILYAGFRWMTAFGNEEKVTNSKDIMEHAAIGLVIVLAAYAISKFLFGSLKEINNPTPRNMGTPCSGSLDPIDCNTQHDDPKTGVPLCRWVGNPTNGDCEDNI